MSSQNSGQTVNYSVRPGKSIERKMIRDILSRLFVFSPLHEYTYIGFGSKYFVDFSLFHKTLNISKMISLEQDGLNRARYEFNKPYNCIKIEFRDSSSWLDQNDLDGKHIVWLDYDGGFDANKVNDLRQLARKLCSGSVFLFSFNYSLPKPDELKKYNDPQISKIKQLFQSFFGRYEIDSDLDNLTEFESRNEYFKKITFYLEKSLTKVLDQERNYILEDSEKLHLKRIFNFTYKDGGPMATLGWLIVKEGDESKFRNMNLDSFNFIDENSLMLNIYHIDPGNFTVREIRYLNELVTTLEEELTPEQKKYFSDKEINKFKEIYKYFPSFTEVEAH
ncbi:O-methyltransferase [Acinetobacter baumannii]|nr:O-methyltransferase [Acinetobacter baumannii]